MSTNPMPTQKKFLFVGIFAVTAALIGGWLFWRYNAGQNDPSKNRLPYASNYFEGLTLSYPKTYSLQDAAPAFRVLTVSKTSGRLTGKMEIFRGSDFPERLVQPPGAAALEDASLAAPQEILKLGKKDVYEVWLYYVANDEATKNELQEILQSIKIDN